MRVDKNSELVDDLATDYKVSDDGLVWDFVIRDNVLLHNGDKLTAKDISFTYKKTRELKVAPELSYINSVRR